MRGIPDKLATREDIYNVAMDLPPDQAKTFLDGLTPARIKGLLNAEELAILKGTVAQARWRADAAGQRLAQRKAELKQARARRTALKRAQRRQHKELQQVVLDVAQFQKDLDRLTVPMADRRPQLQAEIAQAENTLAVITLQQKTHAGQGQKMATQKADIARRIQTLTRQLKQHEKDLAAGHSKATLKKIQAACRTLDALVATRKQLEKQLQQLPGQIQKAQAVFDQLAAPMTDRRPDLQAEISQADNQLATLAPACQDHAGQGKAMAAKKAAIEKQVRQLTKQLETHEKALAAGHSKENLKKIDAAGVHLNGCLTSQERLNRALVQNGAGQVRAAKLIKNLKSKIGEMENG